MMGLLMNLALARAHHVGDGDASAWQLIAMVREARGIVAGDFNEGQVALATWMTTVAGEGRAVGALNFLTSRINEEQTMRWLAGESEPEHGIADYLAEITEGAVRPSMFARLAIAPRDLRNAEAASPAASEQGGRPTAPSGRPPVEIRVSDRLALTRMDGGALLMRTPSFTAKIEAIDMAPLLTGLAAMLGVEARAA